MRTQLSRQITFLSLVLAAIPTTTQAASISYTGVLASSTDVVAETFTLGSTATIGLQTWSFGGGTNAAGNLILPGGTDPFLGIFSGTGATATIVTDGSGNPYGTSLDLGNYGNPSFVGCPPATAPMIGGSTQCGDILMSLVLAAGTYTVILTDGQNVPQAVSDDGTLGEGFTDFTGGAFCNISINGLDCPNTSGNYAFDITGLPSAVPEPATEGLVGVAVLGLALVFKRRTR